LSCRFVTSWRHLDTFENPEIMSANNGSEQCVTLHELSLRNCPQASEGVRFGQCNKRTNEAPDEGWKQSKRQRLRQTRLYSEPYHSPRSSRRSTPFVTVISLDSKENGLDDSDDIEYLYSKKTHRHRDLIHNDLEDKLNAKVRSRSCTSRPYQMNFKC
jgi:hypothetical protein